MPDFTITPTAARFTATHWSVVLRARDGLTPAGTAALEHLCAMYWSPVYVFVRRRVRSDHEAQDLTQDFFAHILTGARLKKVRREIGRFRNFLLGSLRNFLYNEAERSSTIKRGGKQTIVSLDELQAELTFRSEPASDPPSDEAFDHGWAAVLVGESLDRLRGEYADTPGRARVFQALRPLLGNPPEYGDLAAIARPLGLSEVALRAALSRLRNRFREALREQVSHTVTTPGDVDEELRYLLKAWATGDL